MASKNSDLHQSQEKIDRSKRKLAQAGGLVVPAILTLANRPAWAGMECTPSGFTSGLIGSNVQGLVGGNTNWKTAAEWHNSGNWASWSTSFGRISYNSTTFKFHKVPNNGTYNFTGWNGTNEKTLAQVQAVETSTFKLLLKSVTGVSISGLSIYDALASSNTCTANIAASVLNNAVETLPFEVSDAYANNGQNLLPGSTKTWCEFLEYFYSPDSGCV
ncbi:hypothetical protein [Candidatus Methylomicrobium oryzae]|uniref:hypothetical protein n=1 Tax=Candidatus Methylomicrobium oryzae TaxID=2802053 RepID=UPI0019226982|nr:hypothetical protein [Methylomicrobium sp. RS1]MBL1264971.1 hypothetical protein [Methylomicrobium sp. RS1]